MHRLQTRPPDQETVLAVSVWLRAAASRYALGQSLFASPNQRRKARWTATALNFAATAIENGEPFRYRDGPTTRIDVAQGPQGPWGDARKRGRGRFRLFGRD